MLSGVYACAKGGQENCAGGLTFIDNEIAARYLGGDLLIRPVVPRY
jgi:hypothetical protein